MNESPHPSVGARGGRSRRLLHLTLGCLVCALCAPAALAQTNQVQTLSSNRWLLVVDTSRAMRPRAESIRQVAATLLIRGMNGQMRRGDSVGLWTYDAELHMGKFPVHTWTPENSREFARHVFGFLQAQEFQKESRLDQVVPRWNMIVSNSDVLTIVLISGGEEKISGTPFDEAINDVYQGWRDEQENAGMPFITVLRAEHGRITDQKVSMPPWPLELPPLPAEPKVAKVPVKITPPPVVPSLYFSGRKPALSQTQDVSQPKETHPPPSLLSTNSSTAETEKTSASAKIQPSTPPENAAAIPKATVVADVTAKAVEPTTQPVQQSKARSAATDASTPEPGAAAPLAVKPAAVAAASVRSNVAGAQNAAPTSAIAAASPAPSGTFLQRNVIWIGGLILAGVASVLIWMMLRRSRPASRISLITRSLDREKK